MTGSLQIKNNKYYIVLNDYVNGKRKQKWVKTELPIKGNKRKAEQLLRETLQQQEQQSGIVRSDVTFADYVRVWLSQVKRRVDEVTYQGYEILANGHILPYFDASGVKLQDVTRHHLQAYIDEKAASGRKNGKGGLSARSLRLHKNILNQTLTEAVKADLLPANPCQYVDLPSVQRYEAHYYTAQQLQELLELIRDDPLYPLVKITAIYGLRRSELLGLQWDSIDFDRNTLTIRHTVTKVSKAVEKDKTKNASSYRSFPLLPEAREIFLQAKKEEQENRRLRKKFGVLYQLYQETVRRNQELRRQIVSSQDSFGKIFRATQELDVAQPKEVFFKAVKVLEERMENQSIAIYSVGANKDFARLEAASRPIAAEAEQSLRMETLTPALPALQRGEVWVNTEFLPGLPSFLAAVWEQDGPVLLLEVRRADYEQMTLYHQNLFRVLCGLIRSSLLRCLQIQRMRQNEQCVPGTCRLLRAEDFRKEAAVAREMEQAHVACHQLLRLERTRRTPAELDRLLAGRIRENDAAGLLEDGCVWLLLTQATPETLHFVVRRLAAAGLKAQTMKELP